MTGRSPAPLRTIRGRGIVRETLLTTGASLGVLCLLSAVAAPLLGLKLLVFQSGSMNPDIDTGAVAITRTVDADELHRGDIVSVTTSKGTRVTHRVTAITQQGDRTVVQLKGDANNTADSESYPVTEVDRVVAHVNGLGYLVNAIATPYAVFVTGGAAAGLLMLAFRRRGTPQSATSDEPAEQDSAHAADDVTHPESHGRHRRAAVTAGVIVAALGVGTAAWSGVRGGSVVPTLAAFSDTAQVNGSATTLTVPNPIGAINCENGANNSGTVTLDWGDVTGDSTAYQYRVDLSRQDNGAHLHTYTSSTPKVTVHKADVGEVGTIKVELGVTRGDAGWQSESTISRTMWSSSWIAGDINCG